VYAWSAGLSCDVVGGIFYDREIFTASGNALKDLAGIFSRRLLQPLMA
jgi:hypothetical protein